MLKTFIKGMKAKKSHPSTGARLACKGVLAAPYSGRSAWGGQELRIFGIWPTRDLWQEHDALPAEEVAKSGLRLRLRLRAHELMLHACIALWWMSGHVCWGMVGFNYFWSQIHYMEETYKLLNSKLTDFDFHPSFTSSKSTSVSLSNLSWFNFLHNWLSCT